MTERKTEAGASLPLFSGPALDVELPPELVPDTRLRMDGLEFLACLDPNTVPVAFFDPQYRGVLDKLAYGNEGKSRQRKRNELQAMPEATIAAFIGEIYRVLAPSGHLFLWMDKYHLCEGVRPWLAGSGFEIVDLVVWNSKRFGMGYRSRKCAEYCMVLQKPPKRAKGVWRVHTIPDVIEERVSRSRAHPHTKPVGMQAELLAAVTEEGDLVIDPAAGSFSVMAAAHARGRRFLGCDVEG